MTSEKPGYQEVPAALAAELAGTSWDEPPDLYLISRHDGRCELHPLQVPRFLWTAMPFDHVIAVTAGAAAAAARKAGGEVGPDMIGAAVRFEAWTLPWPLLHGPALAQARTDLAAGRVHTRDDRIERRFIFATGRDGTLWEATQLRTQPRPRTITYPPGAPQPSDTNHAYDALRLLTHAVLGHDDPTCEL